MIRPAVPPVETATIWAFIKTLEPSVEANNPNFLTESNASRIDSPAPLISATASQISFATNKWAKQSGGMLSDFSAGLILAPLDFEDNSANTIIRVNNPRLRFAQICNEFFAPPEESLTKFSHFSEQKFLGAVISPNAFIGENVHIGKGTVIGENVVIHSGTAIGADCKISSGVVIGGTGFGYEQIDGEITLFPHYGAVHIGDRVEIGSNTCIDRGSLQNTVVGSDVKIDNLVHIAHNATVEDGSLIIAGVVLCGSSRIGRNSWIAPNAVVGEGVSVGENCTVGFATVVKRNVPANSVANGNPVKIYPKATN